MAAQHQVDSGIDRRMAQLDLLGVDAVLGLGAPVEVAHDEIAALCLEVLDSLVHHLCGVVIAGGAVDAQEAQLDAVGLCRVDEVGTRIADALGLEVLFGVRVAVCAVVEAVVVGQAADLDAALGEDVGVGGRPLEVEAVLALVLEVTLVRDGTLEVGDGEVVGLCVLGHALEEVGGVVGLVDRCEVGVCVEVGVGAERAVSHRRDGDGAAGPGGRCSGLLLGLLLILLDLLLLLRLLLGKNAAAGELLHAQHRHDDDEHCEQDLLPQGRGRLAVDHGAAAVAARSVQPPGVTAVEAGDALLTSSECHGSSLCAGKTLHNPWILPSTALQHEEGPRLCSRQGPASALGSGERRVSRGARGGGDGARGAHPGRRGPCGRGRPRAWAGRSPRGPRACPGGPG